MEEHKKQTDELRLQRIATKVKFDKAVQQRAEEREDTQQNIGIHTFAGEYE